jgi:gliding motility-associated-like protein
MQWIGFVAGTVNLGIEIYVHNCNSGSGLEVGLYKSTDCTTFSKISYCDTDIRQGQTVLFTNTEPLVVGQYYYFVMDGNGNDICDYTISVRSGSTKVTPLTSAPIMTIPEFVCQNEPFEMSTPGLTGATFYSWIIDGVYFKEGKSQINSFSKQGNYKICLDASNVCDAAPQTCKTITVRPTPTSRVIQEICFGECFTFLGKSYCQSGSYDIRLPASNGCDSIITLDLVVDDRITASTSLNICEGDTLVLGNNKFFTDGRHKTVISNQEGCDIYMDINLKLIICNIKSSYKTTEVRCNGENSGEISFAVNSGTPPFTYSAYKIENPSITFGGNVNAVNQQVKITGVDEGNYYISIKDTYGNSRNFNVFVKQPSGIKVTTKVSDYNTYQVSCYGADDGYFRVMPTGGAGSYSFKQIGSPSVSDSLTRLKAGIYYTQVTDQNGCTTQIQTQLRQPEPINMTITSKNPDCNGKNTGWIDISESKGGVLPYTFILNDKIRQQTGRFENLEGGTYALKIQDKNGCLNSGILDVKSIEIPEIYTASNKLDVDLGDSIALIVFSNLAEQTILWTPGDEMACRTCLTTHARPVNDTDFEITVTSKDRCAQRAVIRVRVDKKRSFAISNVITPNGDGQNDKIRYFAGHDVAQVNFFSLYDRWGNLVYHQEALLSGLEEIDWSGQYFSQPLQTGVYTWICDVTYLDSETKTYSGSLTILK